MVSKITKYYHIGLKVNVFKRITSKIAWIKLFKLNHFSVLLVNVGSLHLQIDDKEVTVFENDLIVVPVQSLCSILLMSDNLQICLVSFTSDFIFEKSIRKEHLVYFDFYIKKLPSKIHIKNKDLKHLLFLFEQLYRKTRKSSKQIFKEDILVLTFNLLLYVLAEKYRKYFQQLNENYTLKEKLLIHFFKILEMNFRKQHSVKYYADTLSMTPDNLTKIIKELTEKNTKQFIVDAIVLEAKNLLRNKDLNISNISEELQFSSCSSFSLFFKRHTSVSPTQYRLRFNLN